MWLLKELMVLLIQQNIPKYYVNANGVVGSECFRSKEERKNVFYEALKDGRFN